MHQGRRPLIPRSGRVWAQAMAIVCVAVLAIGAVAAAAPKGEPGPPEQAQGNGPPAGAPQGHGNGPAAAAPQGQAKGLVRKQAATTQAAPPPAGTAPGNSAAGRARAGGGGHAAPAAQVTSGGATGGEGGGEGGATSEKQATAHSKAGHVTLCHATGSAKHPWVEIKVSANAVPAQLRNQGGRTIAPSGGECPGLPEAAANGQLDNPQPGLESPQADEDEDGGQAVEEPSDESDTLGISDEDGAAPGGDGGVLGADQGGGDEDFGVTGEASSASLPFTGLGLGALVALGAMLALAGVYVRRRTTT